MRKKQTYRIISVIAVFAVMLAMLSLSVGAAKMSSVCIGGMPFGVRFQTEGVTVAELLDVKTKDGDVCPARDAGLRRGDVISAVNGKKIGSAADVINEIASAKGAVTLLYRRGGEEHEATVSPVVDEKGIKRAGMLIRDTAAGIGTVTFYDKNSGIFAGLGHGICNAETGELIPLCHGVVTEVSLCGINRGVAGAPGELKGYFSAERVGELTKNTRTGVYGILTKLPSGSGELVQVATKNEILEGDVMIRCTLADGEMRDYTAKISNIDKSGGECKNFIVTVTDAELLRRTGGIVQGMSGSPILQNSKLIGAVTHVMINDPTRGYGIFIENMLNAMG